MMMMESNVCRIVPTVIRSDNLETERHAFYYGHCILEDFADYAQIRDIQNTSDKFCGRKNDIDWRHFFEGESYLDNVDVYSDPPSSTTATTDGGRTRRTSSSSGYSLRTIERGRRLPEQITSLSLDDRY